MKVPGSAFWGLCKVVLNSAAYKYVITLVAVGAAIGWWRSWYPRATVWGDVFTGLAAAGTLIAVGFAIVATRNERAQRLIERADRIQAETRLSALKAQELERQAQAQAANVSWWTTPIGLDEPVSDDYAQYVARHDPPFEDDAHLPTNHYVALHILNSNDAAMRSCSVQVGGNWGGPRSIGFLPPGEHVYVERAGGMTGGMAGLPRLLADIAEGAPVLWVEFVDLGQVVWRTYADGRLEATGNPPADPHGMVI